MASERCDRAFDDTDKGDVYDENDGGMTSDEEDALDIELGLIDDISRQVFNIFVTLKASTLL